jgi:hypothetical protein
MKAFTAMTEIEAPAQTIWQLLTDTAKYLDWNPNLLKAEGNIAQQEELKLYFQDAPNRPATVKVVEFEPNRKMVWRSNSAMGFGRMVRTYKLEPLGSKILFSIIEEYKGLLAPVFSHTLVDLRPAYTHFCEALKQKAETTSKESDQPVIPNL